MKIFAIALILFATGCGNSKTQKRESSADSVTATQAIPPADSIKIANNNPTDTTRIVNEPVNKGDDQAVSSNDEEKKGKQEEEVRYGGFRKTPACVRAMIEKFSKAEVTNPPRKIYQYDYKGKIVFYVPAICCDFFSDLYDMDCNLIGHPDGGYTGKGDGSFPDFSKVRKSEKLVWEDERKR